MSPLIRSFCESRRYLQSLFLFKKLLPSSKPEISVLPSIIKSCSYMPSLDAGLVIHGFLMKCGFSGCCVDVGNDLRLMYMQFGRVQDAFNVFDEMPNRSVGDAFDRLIRRFGVNGQYEDVVIAFRKMVELRVYPNTESMSNVIRACGDLSSIEEGIFVHDYVKENGFDKHVYIMNSLISMFVKMGRMDLAQWVFDDVIDKDIVSWNSLITGYAHHENWPQVFDLFLSLRRAAILVPNVVTFLALLSTINQPLNLSIGMSIHGHLICTGLYSDVQLGTAIVDMYAKCERLDFSQIVFEKDLLIKTLVSWNAIIARYTQKGYNFEAIKLYERMITEPDIKPDAYSYANVLPACASLGNLRRIKSIHSMIIKRSLDVEGDVVLCTAMVDAYGKCSDVQAAESLFACNQRPNTATWNALLAIYNLNNQLGKGMIFFIKVVRNKVLIDPITIVAVFQLCGQMGSLKQGNMIHGYSILKGFHSHLIVGNAIIDMYMRCKSMKSAEVFFNSMSMESIVTWNIMIYGYMKAGCTSMGMKLFCQMQSEKAYMPDSITFISVLQASASFLANYVELLHAYIVRLGLVSETLVMNTLIDAYAKNGLVEKAGALFMQNDFIRDQSSWNIMIAGYGMNGQGKESSKLFLEMENNGYMPDSITFTSLLSSCSHCGLIEEGFKFFDLMITKYKIRPSMEHWTCIIDLFARAGGLEEAYDVIKTGVFQKSNCDAVWGALLSACTSNMNMKLGELAGARLMKMEPDNCGYYSLLSNLYSSNKKWDEARRIRRVFGDGKVMKNAGLSVLKS